MKKEPRSNPYFTNFGKFIIATCVFTTAIIGGLLVVFYGWIIFNDNSCSSYALCNINHRRYAMSKKEYEKFAELIREYVSNDGFFTITDIADGMCVIFKEDNRNFDKNKFIRACNLERVWRYINGKVLGFRQRLGNLKLPLLFSVCCT